MTDKMRCEAVSIFYDGIRAIHDVTMGFPACSVTTLVGPSGCGKSTLLRALNRMLDTVDGARVQGRISLDDEDIYAPAIDPVDVRRNVGMVFQKSNPFPKSIFENVAFPLRIDGRYGRDEIRQRVETSLRSCALWNEVCDRLDDSALGLSGGQQQRLCLARTLAMEPEVVLMDEPTSALDPIATEAIEALIAKLKRELTIVLVTHSMQQARRVSDYTAFLYLGELVECGPTEQLFEAPRRDRTRDYFKGRFG